MERVVTCFLFSQLMPTTSSSDQCLQCNKPYPTVTNFNNGLEASSDSDDEDKLHIVEEESLQEPDATTNAKAAIANGDQASDAIHAASAVLAQNGSWNGGPKGLLLGEAMLVPRGSGITIDI
ncbi:hypothetical protein NHX12_004136 [Muraenolepis orangiensis]|uniref:Uncharacterized protein n=1 Tax=Muraenolepis orangiensis TaxID=630683 RepID=A0A9Q0DUN2_9TELE|nr:hypothetical protein NHX12_004136 [Muraenolepis orangiensis]